MTEYTSLLVLGGSGMLGSMVADVLSRNSHFRLRVTVRSSEILNKCRLVLPEIQWELWDALAVDEEELYRIIGESSWVINAIGIIKPHINDKNPKEVERAILINALFPHLLAHVANEKGVRVLQIATDCVYCGNRGSYIESDFHDALDVYGKTKSLGECNTDSFFNLRCSIIGPEVKSKNSLLEWFLDQSTGIQLNGFTNHLWNGVTTLQFARICEGIISSGLDLGNLHHIVPFGSVTKYELLDLFRRYFDRDDIVISTAKGDQVIDRTLLTNNSDINNNIWTSAGYLNPPTIKGMIEELSDFDYRFK